MLIRNLVLLLSLGSGAMFATTMGVDQTTCPTASLSTYAGLGSAGCLVNGVLYNNFTFLLGYSNGATPIPTAADIQIAPNIGATGFDFAYPVITRNYVTFALQYDFDPPPATGGTLELDVQGDVDVFQSLCPGGPFRNVSNGCFGRPNDTTPVNMEVYNQHLGATKLTDAAVINPPAAVGQIQLYFALNGLPGAPAGFDRLTSGLTPGSPVTPVPEPKTYLILAVGFALLIGLRASLPVRN